MKSTPSRPEGGARPAVRFYLLDHETPLGKAIDITLLLLNLVFVGIVVAETYPLPDRLQTRLWSLEVGISVLFLVEYVLRLYGAQNRLAEFLNGYTIVDFIAILPTFLVLLFPLSAIGMSVSFLRVIRVIRVLRFYRFTQDAEFFFGTISDNTLRAVKLLLTVLVLFFISAGMFYTVEQGVNPDVNTFGDAYYYTVIAVTTVGFGDIIPMTTAGRWVTVSTIIAGIIVIPWQAGKIVREWRSKDKINVTCPECGLSYHDSDASHCKACGSVIYQEYDSRQ